MEETDAFAAARRGKAELREQAMLDARGIDAVRRLAPQYPAHDRAWVRLRLRLSHVLGDWLVPHYNDACCYCGRMSRVRTRGYVNPLTLQRGMLNLCTRTTCGQAFSVWVGVADARRRRAQWDREQESPTVAALGLIGGIPQQYPSVSRATLRAFLDSDYESALVEESDGMTATALNGSIRALGYDREVFAEVRAGQAVLRKAPHR